MIRSAFRKSFRQPRLHRTPGISLHTPAGGLPSHPRFLTSLTVKSVLEKNTPDSLVFCDIQDPLPTAMKKLVDNKILAMPVYDIYTKEYKGLVGMLEIVNFIAQLHWELLLESVPYREADIYVRFNDTVVADLVVPGHVKIHDTSNFAVVAQTLLATDYRRIPVVDDTGAVIHVITVSEVVSSIYQGLSTIDPSFLKQSVASLPSVKHVLDQIARPDSKLDLFESTGVMPVNQVAKTIEAFRLLIGTKVSAVPIVDDDQQLIGCISVRDIRKIANNASDIQVLYALTAGEFCKKSSLTVDDISISPHDRLETLVQKLNKNKVHRVWVRNDNGLLIGAVTVKHLLAEMMAFTPA